MRRTWNSWTYYGPDQASARTEPGPTGEESQKDDEPRPSRSRGAACAQAAPQGAFEQSMANALERAMDLSDVRKERVSRVKRAIAAGNYQVSARELAEKLVRNMLGEYR